MEAIRNTEKEPHMAGSDLIQMSNVVRYLGIFWNNHSFQQPHQSED